MTHAAKPAAPALLTITINPQRRRALELVIGDRLGNPSQQLRQVKTSGYIAASSQTPLKQLRLTAPLMDRRS